MTPIEYAHKLSEIFRGTLNENMGIELVSASGARGRAELAIGPAVAQPTGLFHAGAIIALADVAATSACLAETNPKVEPRPDLFPLAIQISSNLVGNTNQGRLTADAEIIHRGRKTMVGRVRVTHERGKLVAKIAVTLACTARNVRQDCEIKGFLD